MRLLLLIFLFVGIANVNASALQKKEDAQQVVAIKKPQVEKLDSSKVSVRKFDEQAISTYSKQKAFIYDDVPPKTMSLWDRFWRWIWGMINALLSGKTSGTIIKYVLIAIVVAVIVFVAIKLIGLDYKLLAKKSRVLEVPFEESLENIHEIDFDEQLAIAMQNKNYRLVVRLLYLKTLKKLTDQQVINWQPEKTNQDYVVELIDKPYYQEFASLTNQFEYVWYGEFYINEASFKQIQQSFQVFNQKTA